MRCSFRFAVAILALVIWSQRLLADEPGLKYLMRPDVREVKRIRDIDPDVIAKLKSRFDEDKRLADVGVPFSAGDAMLPGYNPPSRRLVVAAQTSDRWFHPL